MKNKSRSTLQYFLISSTLLLSLALSSFFTTNIRSVHAQGSIRRNANIPLPIFKLPYDEEITVYWTGGPHAYNKGADITATYSTGEGSGLDFSNGTNFNVLAMATGEVIDADCNNGFFGCQVAIQHFTGGTVMIYAHLQDGSIQVSVGQHVIAGDVLGRAGNTGRSDAPIHLHVEFRNGQKDEKGNWLCWWQCLPEGLGGNPFGWDDGLPLVDGYRIFSYLADDEGLNSYNYDGSAVNGATKELMGQFYFIDGDTMKPAYVVRVGENFSCLYPNDSNKNCELPENQNNPDKNTKFATTNRTYTFSSSLNMQDQGMNSNPPRVCMQNIG